MKRFGLWIVAMGLLASACQGRGAVSLGSAPSGSPGSSPSGSPTPTSTETPSPTVSPTQSSRKLTFEVWFLNHGQLFVTKRTEPFSARVAQLALDSLLDGPANVEFRAGVRTAIAAGTSGEVTGLSNGVATVDLSDAFYNETAFIMRLRQAQVVYTLTHYPTIRGVKFARGKALKRADFEDILPAILVETPLIGSKVSSPVTVSGTANVFEATVSLRILDENGKEIARTFTTATCGTGCRGDYSVSVPFNVDHQQEGTVEVYESSAKDGSPINVVDIPVILVP
jgi:immunoglobulin-like protein involved in spore germination/sporulation and spore germination protein